MNEQLKQLLKAETGDQIISVKLNISVTPADTPEQVWEQVCAFPFHDGWICATGTVVPLYAACDLAKLQGSVILSAELANDGESMHVRQAESGWNIIRMKKDEGEECLMIREEYIGTENKQQDRLKYEVYWKNDHGSYRPWVARFAGMVKGGTING